MKKQFQWLDKTEYPFTPHYYRINGYDLHYVDEGEGPVLLYVHGTPSWSFDFRNVIKPLSNHFRCIAIDHMGFGLSDKPKSYDYTTLNHSKTLEKFILDKNLANITLVVHDFGGPIGLNFAINYPDRIKQIVVMNSWLWSAEHEPDFKKMSKVLKNPLLPFLYRKLNFSARFILPKVYYQKPSKKTLKHYTRPFPSSKEREGMVAFTKSLLNDQAWFQELWEKKKPLETKKTLFLWEMKDPLLGPKYLSRFEEAFRKSKTISFAHAGHFPQEEEAERVTEEILAWN
ncbi:MAG: alpha/beta fold hydrolase [Cyclobacteriaceae bacterium]